MTDLDEIHDVKGLAEALKRNPSYLYDMRSAGFEMPGNRASLRMALQWLADHSDFTRRQAATVRFARRAAVSTNTSLAQEPAEMAANLVAMPTGKPDPRKR